jgi:hypothetical protein
VCAEGVREVTLVVASTVQSCCSKVEYAARAAYSWASTTCSTASQAVAGMWARVW